VFATILHWYFLALMMVNRLCSSIVSEILEQDNSYMIPFACILSV
jgi:hypothetical protein